jgi:hypothetical protein
MAFDHLELRLKIFHVADGEAKRCRAGNLRWNAVGSPGPECGARSGRLYMRPEQQLDFRLAVRIFVKCHGLLGAGLEGGAGEVGAGLADEEERTGDE